MFADGAEADQVREDRLERPVRLQLVELPDLRVAVAVRGVGELERDERVAVGAVEVQARRGKLVDEIGSGEDRQEVVDDQPLVVPAQRAASRI